MITCAIRRVAGSGTSPRVLVSVPFSDSVGPLRRGARALRSVLIGTCVPSDTRAIEGIFTGSPPNEVTQGMEAWWQRGYARSRPPDMACRDVETLSGTGS